MGFLATWISAPIRLVRRRLAARTKKHRLSGARALVASGQLERAATEYAALGEAVEASRVLVAAAELAADPVERFHLLTRALAQAGDDQPELRLRRSELCIDLVRSGSLRLPPSELGRVARSLAELGRPLLAAEAYALAGDTEAQATELVRAGSVERVEELLDRTEQQRRDARSARELVTRARDLHQLGARREALGLLRELCAPNAAAEPSPLEGALELLREIERRRADGARLRLEHEAGVEVLVFGDRVTVGRSGTISIAAPSLSREHLAVERGERGIVVRDLGSRNGTSLGGARLAAAVELGDKLDLELGGDVALSIEATAQGVRLSWADQSVVAPLGPHRIGAFQLQLSADDWVELERVGGGTLALAGLTVEGPIQLCRGDAIAETLADRVRLRILE